MHAWDYSFHQVRRFGVIIRFQTHTGYSSSTFPLDSKEKQPVAFMDLSFAPPPPIAMPWTAAGGPVAELGLLDGVDSDTARHKERVRTGDRRSAIYILGILCGHTLLVELTQTSICRYQAISAQRTSSNASFGIDEPYSNCMSSKK